MTGSAVVAVRSVGRHHSSGLRPAGARNCHPIGQVRQALLRQVCRHRGDALAALERVLVR